MTPLRWTLCALVLVAAQAHAVDDAAPVHRNQSGTINYAPRPEVYTVLAVDPYDRVLRLRARNGAVAEVYVGEGVFDLSRLQPGSRVRVDFLVPDEKNTRLAAATIWPQR